MTRLGQAIVDLIVHRRRSWLVALLLVLVAGGVIGAMKEATRTTSALDGLPILAGMSRKSMLGAITGRPVGERLAASVSAALIAAQHGARILRVHDVAATRDALSVWQAVQTERDAFAQRP